MAIICTYKGLALLVRVKTNVKNCNFLFTVIYIESNHSLRYEI